MTRKIVSEAGFTELVPVRVTAAGLEPLAPAARASMAALAAADGFIVLAEATEGLAPGTTVAIVRG